MRRSIIAALAAAPVLALAAAVPASAAPSRIPSNPLYIEQANGNSFYVAATDISAGNPVTENFFGSARKLTWAPTGSTYNGSPVGYLKLSNGNPIAAVTTGSNTCARVTIKSDTTSNGTAWAWNTATGNLMINRYCGQNFDPEMALSGTNGLGDQWSVSAPAAGEYRQLTIFHANSPMRPASAKAVRLNSVKAAKRAYGPLCDNVNPDQCARIQDGNDVYNQHVNNGCHCAGPAENIQYQLQSGSNYILHWQSGNCLGLSATTGYTALVKDCTGPDPRAYGTLWTPLSNGRWKNNRNGGCLWGGGNGTQLFVSTCDSNPDTNYGSNHP